ncbi:MAG TPA: hypothetical protein EYH06_10755 [Chromatiales bacterium]|nr:hypothetical protein [Thiotrichales bacterium]HIP69048.1 hypothetical protein [Chromatiales bacterium]
MRRSIFILLLSLLLALSTVTTAWAVDCMQMSTGDQQELVQPHHAMSGETADMPCHDGNMTSCSDNCCVSCSACTTGVVFQSLASISIHDSLDTIHRRDVWFSSRFISPLLRPPAFTS